MKKLFAILLSVLMVLSLSGCAKKLPEQYDEETLLNSLRKTKACVVCENHNLVGGLYSAVSELLCSKLPMKVEKIGIPDRFGEVGKMPYLKEIMGMTTNDIVEAIRRAVNNK